MIKTYPLIIGLNSPAPQSGKSTVCQAIAAKNDATVYSIAGGIRDLAHAMGLSEAADAVGESKDLPSDTLEGRTPREAFIGIGNSMRAIHGESVWVDRLIAKIKANHRNGDIVLIDDVRLQCEGDAVFNLGGAVVTIVREGAVPNPDDVQGFEPVFTVHNNSTVDECADAVMDHVEDAMNLRKAS